MLRIAATALVCAQLGASVLGCKKPVVEIDPPEGSYRVVTVMSRIGKEPRNIGLAYVRPEFFGGVAVKPLLGRFFTPDEFVARAGLEVVGVLTYDYWSQELYGRPDVIGRKVDIDGVWPTIVGIAPKDLVFPHGSLVAVPEAR